MSKGTPFRSLRVPEEMCQEIEAAMASANAHRAEAPYTWSDWVRKAIAEKLAHLKRARTTPRRSRAKKKAALALVAAGPQVQGEAHRPPSLI